MKSLPELRVAIDAVDQQLLALLNQRASLAQEVGEVKKLDGSPVFRPDREAQVINKMQAALPGEGTTLEITDLIRGELGG